MERLGTSGEGTAPGGRVLLGEDIQVEDCTKA
jgi:hypothetical protein